MKQEKKFSRRADARPDEVLDAAIAVFAQKGYARTKMDDIAKAAGISKGTVYLYFPSKDALVEGIVRRAVTPIAEGALPQLAAFQGDPRLPITMLIKVLVGLLGDPERLAVPRLILREGMNIPAIAEIYRRDVLDLAIPTLTGLVERGIASGHLRPLDPELTVRSIIGPVIAHLMLSEVFGIRPEGKLSFDRLMENHLNILFDGISAQKAEDAP
ncbi:TetR/AcrR family transcriptional regulator [Devosia sp. XK-2]|uniref:TetR/AcrR family transcriptional regulator n=1 Tax=Devosia sp. XK-2 TaxID=3126689 RepID=UPI0030CBD43E